MNILIAGGSWITASVWHMGSDAFSASSYSRPIETFRDTLAGWGHTVELLPNEVVPREFPQTATELEAFNAIVLTDCSAHTLLHPDTFWKSEPTPDRLELLKAYVAGGGVIVMIGGYMSFQGWGGRAGYHGTGVEEALPVSLSPFDDHVERPAGIRPELTDVIHPITDGLTGSWPLLLGYNRVTTKPGASALLTCDGHPLLVLWSYGRGRAVAFTSGCVPHWAPPSATENELFRSLWQRVFGWLEAPESGAAIRSVTSAQ